MNERRVTWGWVGGILLVVSQASGQQAAPPTVPGAAVAVPGGDQLDALAKLNQQFRVSYAAARAEVLSESYPVLLYDGSKLILLVDSSQRLEGEPVPILYHRLKALAHLPFTVYLELRSVTGPLSEEKTARLVALRKQIAAAEAEMPSYEFGGYDPARQQRFVTESATFVDRVIAERRCTPEELARFAAKLGPDMYENTLSAAAVELGHHHQEIAHWLGELSETQKGRLRVVVCGSQMPRAEHRIVQLTAALLGEKGEGRRIVYAEAIYEEQRALNLLGTHLLDAGSAGAFFGDATKLDRDILADGAARYVREKIASGKR